jgi:hypothetical protein
MITLEEKEAAETVALLGIANDNADSDAFDWRAFYTEKALAFTEAAKSWRQIAHTAQLCQDNEVVMRAVTNALENESFTREAAFNAKLH